MATSDPSIDHVSYRENVAPETTEVVDVDYSHSWSRFDIPSDDRCGPWYSRNVDMEMRLSVDGRLVDVDDRCVQRFEAGPDTLTWRLEYTVPNRETVELRIDAMLSNTREVLDTAYVTVPVDYDAGDPDPGTYDAEVTSVPTVVQALEPFEVIGQAEAVGGDAPEADWKLEISGETVESGTVQLDDGETMVVEAGPQGIFITEAGTHTIRFSIGNATSSRQVQVEEIDPPYEPLPGDGEPPSRRSLLPLAALGAGAYLVATDDGEGVEQ